MDRFVEAQVSAYPLALRELREGRKFAHWMWFIFPQMKGLGQSARSEYYGLESLAEAQAYAQHPILGPRLRECTELVNAHKDRTADQIFGYPDTLKFRSCMSLFRVADSEAPCFRIALDQFFEGSEDAATLRLLGPPAD